MIDGLNKRISFVYNKHDGSKEPPASQAEPLAKRGWHFFYISAGDKPEPIMLSVLPILSGISHNFYLFYPHAITYYSYIIL